MRTNISISSGIIFLFLLFAQQARAQSGVSLYNEAIRTQQEAIELENKLSPDSKQERLEVAQKYEAAASKFMEAAGKLRGAEEKGAFNAYVAYTRAGRYYFAADQKAKAFEAVKKAVEAWPQPGHLPLRKLEKESTARENGKRFRLEPVTNDTFYLKTFYDGRALAAVIAMENGDQQRAASFAMQIVDKSDDYPELVWGAQYILWKHDSEGGHTCDAMGHALKSLEYAPAGRPAELREVKEGYITAMTTYIVSNMEQECATGDLLADAAIALSKINWVRIQRQALLIGNKAYDKGNREVPLYFAMADLAHELGDTQVEQEWIDKAMPKKRQFSSEDWTQLAIIYGRKNETQKADYANRRARRKFRWERTYLLVGTNPVNLFFGEYLASVDFMRPNFSYSFRGNYISNSTKYFLHNTVEENFAGLMELDYKGYQLGFTIKYLFNKERKRTGKYAYAGPEFRYTFRDFKQTDAWVVRQDDIQVADTIPVSGVNYAYDVTMLFGQIVKSKYFFYDFYAGVGFGYKSLETQGAEGYRIRDERLRDERWNKFYIPVRFGIRIGLALG